MTTLSTVRVAAGLTFGTGAAVGVATVAPDVYLVHVPVAMASGSAALFITLGYILGKAARTAGRTGQHHPGQVTDVIARPQADSRPLPKGTTPTLVILPVRDHSGGDAE